MISIDDSRAILPKHSSKRWARRRIEEIHGLVVHQTAGSRTALANAEYHVGANHISATGCPGLCYTYFIETDGKIIWANDQEDITWSQATDHGRAPWTDLNGNRNFISVCVGGNFSAEGYVGKHIPTDAQIASLEKLWEHLQATLKLKKQAIFGHYHFGKPTCPGTVLSTKVEEWRSKGVYLPQSDAEWQLLLVACGFDLGNFGPGQNGVDGHWGRKSQQALIQAQTSFNIPITGYRDRYTAIELANSVVESR